MIYRLGDHLIDHTTRTVKTFPLFATVGLRELTVRPVAVEELVDVMEAALRGRLERKTVEVVGAEELKVSKVVRRVAEPLPEDLRPKKMLTKAQIRAATPDAGPFGLSDLRISK